MHILMIMRNGRQSLNMWLSRACACNWPEFQGWYRSHNGCQSNMPRFAIHLCTIQSFEIYMLIIQSSAGIFYRRICFMICSIGKILKLHRRTKVAYKLWEKNPYWQPNVDYRWTCPRRNSSPAYSRKMSYNTVYLAQCLTIQCKLNSSMLYSTLAHYTGFSIWKLACV